MTLMEKNKVASPGERLKGIYSAPGTPDRCLTTQDEKHDHPILFGLVNGKLGRLSKCDLETDQGAGSASCGNTRSRPVAYT